VGHGASLKDPYAAFELFHGKYSAEIGTTAGTNRWSRYNNPEYDAILMMVLLLTIQFHELAVQAMEIYRRDQIDIPTSSGCMYRLQPDLLGQLANTRQPGCRNEWRLWAHTGSW
jgi:hypothetical protein